MSYYIFKSGVFMGHPFLRRHQNQIMFKPVVPIMCEQNARGIYLQRRVNIGSDVGFTIGYC